MNQQQKPLSPEILDRLPPHNLEAEWGVIGSMMLKSDVCDEMALRLKPEDFHRDANACLFGHLMDMHNAGKPIDSVLLKKWLQKAGDFERIGGTAYLAEVATSVPHAGNAKYYARLVQETSALRALIHASTEVLRDAYDPHSDVEDLVTRAEQQVLAVRDRHTPHQVAELKDVLIEVFESLDHPERHGAQPTGFSDLDKLLAGGLHDTELIVIAARTGMGKTALATNIAEYVAVDCDKLVLLVTLEMSAKALTERILCGRAQVDGHKLRGGFLSVDDRKALVAASNEMADKPLHIDDTSGRSVSHIAAFARRLKRRKGLALLVVDYLGLIEPADTRVPRQEQVSANIRRLKMLARELDVPVLCLAQLNREADDNKRPKLSQLRESGAIEQDADVVLFIHRLDYHHTREEARDAQTEGKAELTVAKNRNGPTGVVKLVWFDHQTRFAALANKPYDDEFPEFGDDR